MVDIKPSTRRSKNIEDQTTTLGAIIGSLDPFVQSAKEIPAILGQVLQGNLGPLPSYGDPTIAEKAGLTLPEITGGHFISPGFQPPIEGGKRDSPAPPSLTIDNELKGKALDRYVGKSETNMPLTPQMLAMLALKNPELLATMLAAKGVKPEQLQMAQAPTPAAPTPQTQGGQQMATAPVGGPIPMPVPGQAFPGTMPAAPAAAPTAQPQLALGDILAGVKTPSVATQPRPGAVAPQMANFNPNTLALLQWLAQNGAGGTMSAPTIPPSLGQLLGR